MLTILYPENDFTSADIAIRTQALAKGQGRSIYVVPKHFGRAEESVYKNLSKTTSALFIAFDAKKIDENTAKELAFLSQKGIASHALIPDDMNIPALLPDGVNNPVLQNFKPYKYSQSNKSDFADAVKRFSENLKSDAPSKSTSNDALAVVGILLLSILFLGLVSDGKK